MNKTRRREMYSSGQTATVEHGSWGGQAPRMVIGTAVCVAFLLAAAVALFPHPAPAADTTTTVAGAAATPAATTTPATAATPATAGAPAADTTGISASQMKVSVEPEYDDPRVLVINQADLDAGVQLPTDVTFNIPKGAEIGMACEIDAANNHNCKPYSLVDKGDYQALTYKVETQRKIFMEYYYEAVPSGQAQRDFTYTFRPGFAAKTLTMDVQEPLRATGFTTTPNLPNSQTNSEGITSHAQDWTDVTPATPIVVKVSYSKPDFKTSVKLKDKTGTASGAAGSGPAGLSSGGGNRTLFLVLGVLGIGALFFAGYKVMRPAPVTGRSAPRGGSRPAGRGSSGNRDRDTVSAASLARSGVPGGTKGGTKFCTACGAGIRKQDQFCAECGEDQG